MKLRTFIVKIGYAFAELGLVARQFLEELRRLNRLGQDSESADRSAAVRRALAEKFSSHQRCC